MTSTFTTYSAAITSFKTVDGKETSLHFDNVKNYDSPKNQYLGASVGRVANRIFGPTLTVAGKEYPLQQNAAEGVTLHGGKEGFAKRHWKGPFTETRSDGKTSTVFTIDSEHLDQGFPGTLHAKVIYTPYVEGKKAYLEYEYEAVLDDNSPVDETVASFTNHNFFNIAADPKSIAGSKLKVFTNKYIVADKGWVPTGEIADFPGLPNSPEFFDLTQEGPKIDNTFVVDGDKIPESTGIDTRKTRKLAPLAHLYDPDTKINVKVLSTEPVFQIYTGDYFNTPQLEGESRGFTARAGIAFEPARPTNAANRPEWRPWVTLKKGEKYGSKTVYVSWVGEPEED